MNNRIEIIHIEHHRTTFDKFFITSTLVVETKRNSENEKSIALLNPLMPPSHPGYHHTIPLTVEETERLIHALKKGLEILAQAK